MKRGTYLNRHININYATVKVGELQTATATQLSKEMNLSRQALLNICKHAVAIGYMTMEQEPYRFRKDGTVLVYRNIFKATNYGLENAKWYCKAIDKTVLGRAQLPLL